MVQFDFDSGYPLELTSWEVKNFKGLAAAKIDLGGLSVLCGANSAGKSSLIQSMLLVSQSTEKELVLNGTLVRLGQANEVIRDGKTAIEFSWSFQDREEPYDSFSAEIQLHAAESIPTELAVKTLTLRKNNVVILDATVDRVGATRQDEVGWIDRPGTSLLRVRKLATAEPTKFFLEVSGIYPSRVLRKNYKDNVVRAVSSFLEGVPLDTRDPMLSARLARYVIRTFLEDHQRRFPGRDSDLVDSLRGLIDNGVSAPSDSETKQLRDGIVALICASETSERQVSDFRRGDYFSLSGPPAFSIEETRVLGELSRVFDSLREFGKHLRYIGPLREEPQVLSTTGGRNTLIPAGQKGEYTADLLYRMSNSPVSYTDPNMESKTAPVYEALGDWARYLEIVDKVAVRDEGKLGRGLRLSLDGSDRDLTTVGVGASQLLPVLTLVLLAEPGSIVVLEQPELHLHPSVQARLADFFLFSRPDVAIIVETHSEYLVTRLRRRAAEDRSGDLRIHVYFAEGKRGSSTIADLGLGDLGEMDYWPAGFFDAQDTEARMLLLAVRNRLRERE